MTLRARLLVLEVDRDLAFAVAKGCDLFRVWARTNGVPVPAGLADLVELASTGHRRSQGDTRSGMAEGGSMTTSTPLPLLYDLGQVAELLRVSERTVRRLLARGELRPVQVGACTRVAHDELAAFVERLRDQGTERLS